MLDLTLKNYEAGCIWVILHSSIDCEESIKIVDLWEIRNLKSDPFTTKIHELGHVVWNDKERYIQCKDMTSYKYIIEYGINYE